MPWVKKKIYLENLNFKEEMDKNVQTWAHLWASEKYIELKRP
jgi:hypothetical protein